MILAAGVIWALIAVVYQQNGVDHAAEQAVRHNLLEYAELMLFLLVAMTYINAMDERQVFEALRSWLVKKGIQPAPVVLDHRIIAFLISPVADNPDHRAVDVRSGPAGATPGLSLSPASLLSPRTPVAHSAHSATSPP